MNLTSLIENLYDVAIDPVVGSGSTLKSCYETDRHSFDFEIDKKKYKLANEKMLKYMTKPMF